MQIINRAGIMVYLNEKGQEVGFISANNEYLTTRNYDKNQIFKHPKYKNALAIDIAILNDLIKRGIPSIKIRVLNFEEGNFWAVIKPKDYLARGEKFNHDKKNKYGESYTGYTTQIRLPLDEFVREYPSTEKRV